MRSIVWALTSSFFAHHFNFFLRSTPTGVVAAALFTTSPRSISASSSRSVIILAIKSRNSSSPRRNSKREMPNDSSPVYTTNEEDQREAAALQARLKNRRHPTSTRTASSEDELRLPSVEIDEGAHKYVLIKAIDPENGNEQYFVTSRKGAHYHRNAAEPMIAKLEEAGYEDIDVTGGGRIDLNVTSKTCRIFGFSYSFGLANHAISQQLIRADTRFRDFEITISDDGY
jgi:phosphohistidine phosphatase